MLVNGALLFSRPLPHSYPLLSTKVPNFLHHLPILSIFPPTLSCPLNLSENVLAGYIPHSLHPESCTCYPHPRPTTLHSPLFDPRLSTLVYTCPRLFTLTITPKYPKSTPETTGIHPPPSHSQQLNRLHTSTYIHTISTLPTFKLLAVQLLYIFTLVPTL